MALSPLYARGRFDPGRGPQAGFINKNKFQDLECYHIYIYLIYIKEPISINSKANTEPHASRPRDRLAKQGR